jgi:hypothetical protein
MLERLGVVVVRLEPAAFETLKRTAPIVKHPTALREKHSSDAELALLKQSGVFGSDHE